MVTHDVALKNYANKVIRLVDGKINKIEEIPKGDRDSAIQNLNDIISKDMENQAAFLKNADQLGVREGNIYLYLLFSFVLLTLFSFI